MGLCFGRRGGEWLGTCAVARVGLPFVSAKPSLGAQRTKGSERDLPVLFGFRGASGNWRPWFWGLVWARRHGVAAMLDRGAMAAIESLHKLLACSGAISATKVVL